MSEHSEDADRREASPLTAHHLTFDLTAEFERLKAAPTWSGGHSARTLIKYDDLRIVLIALAAGARIPEHKAEGRVSVQVLAGHIQLRIADQVLDFRAGGLVALDRAVPHDVAAIEESAFLLTIAWPRTS